MLTEEPPPATAPPMALELVPPSTEQKRSRHRMPGVRRGSKLAKKSLLEQSAALDLADAMGCDPRCKRSFLGRCILYIADERNIATNSFSEIFHVSRLYQCNPHVSSRTASLAIIVPTRSPFFEISKSQKSEHDTRSGLSRPH